ncbi:MAG: hypothetical protein QOK28_928 [Actinomycetota bacterium]|jgi:uncharacterized RDD family membrane protein YckC
MTDVTATRTTASTIVGTLVTPNGLPLTSVGKRLGGYLLDGILAVVTLGIGWVIWACFTFGKGQTPAKQLLNTRVVKPDTGRALGWGEMFVREVVYRGIVAPLLSFVTLGVMGLVGPLLILGGDRRQTLWDRMAGTVVVDDPNDVSLMSVPVSYRPVTQSSARACPYCAETILAAAVVCKHCGREVPAEVHTSVGHPPGTCQECGAPIPKPSPVACPRCREPYGVRI